MKNLILTFGALKPAQKETIITHEIATMLPILQAIDLPVSAEGIRKSIERDEAQTVILLAGGPEDTPRAWIRYGRGEESLFVKSIQLGRSPLNLRPLLRASLMALAAEGAPAVVSVVQGGNDASLSLHRKLGFQIEKELPRATRFAIEREELLQRIVSFTAPAKGP